MAHDVNDPWTKAGYLKPSLHRVSASNKGQVFHKVIARPPGFYRGKCGARADIIVTRLEARWMALRPCRRCWGDLP